MYKKVILFATVTLVLSVTVSNAEIILVGECEVPRSDNQDVFVLGDYAYFSDYDHGLLVIDISDPENPEITDNWEPDHGYVVAVHVIGEIAYALDGARRIYSVDVSDPENVEQIGELQIPSAARDLYVSDGFAYIANYEHGLRIVDISNPRDMDEIGSCDTPTRALGVYISGDYAYIADFNRDLVIINISNPEDPDIVGSCNFVGESFNVSVSGNYAYVAANNGGVRIIDVSDPEEPDEVGHCDIERAYDIFVSGNHAFVVTYNGRYFYVADVTDPENPEIVDSYQSQRQTLAVTVVGNFAYVANEICLLIFDVSDYIFQGPFIEVSDEELDFEEVGLNLSRELPLTITNIGNEDLIVSEITVEGDYFSSDFEDEITIEPDEDHDLTVTFAPEERGEFEGTLTITSNDEENEEVEVVLYGVGVGPIIAVQPRSLDFGAVGIDQSEERTLTIHNRGLNDLIISEVTLTVGQTFLSDFEEEITIEPDERHQLTVTFTPVLGIPYADTLTITSNDPDNETVTIPMCGLGQGAVIVVEPDTVQFGRVGRNRSAERVVTIGNEGELDLNVSEIYVEGNWFSLDLDTVYVIPPDNSLDATITFAPEEIGDFRALLFISSDDRQDDEVIIPLFGTGAGPTIAVDREAIDFGLLPVDESAEQQLTIRAVGLTDLTIHDITIRGALTFLSEFEDTVFIPLDSSYVLPVTFSPDDDGLFEAVLTIYSDDPDNSELTVDLSGAAHRGVIFDTPESTLGITVVEDYAYIAGTDYLHVVDVSDPNNPEEAAAYYQEGLNAQDVAVVDTCIFVAAAEEGLLILSISNPEEIHVLGSYDTPGCAWSVAVRDGYAFVADGESGLRVIDLYDMERLFEVNYVDTPGEARGITINGNYAYIADYVHGLRIIDISDPQEPFETGYYNTRGLSFDVSLSDDYAYMADERQGMRIIDISDPESPEEIGFYDTDGNAYGIMVDGIHAYLSDGAGGMCMLDVSEPERPNLVKIFYTPGSAGDVFFSDNYAYVTNGERGVLIIDVTDYLFIDDTAESQFPDDFLLFPAYPNPFNTSTTITFGLPCPAPVSIRVYDVTGRLTAILSDGERLAGLHTVVWNSGNIKSGVYLVRLEALGFSDVCRVMLVK